MMTADGCLPACDRQGQDAGGAGSDPTAATGPLVFRAQTRLVAGRSGGWRSQEIAGKERPRAGGLDVGMAVLSVSLQPCTHTPDPCPALCPMAEPVCLVPCEQGEASPPPLAAEPESPACYMSCLTITAALLCPGMHPVGCNGPYNLPRPHVFWEGCPGNGAMGQKLSKPWQELYPTTTVVACPQQSWGSFFDCFQAGRFAAVSQIPCWLAPFLGILDRANNTPGC